MNKRKKLKDEFVMKIDEMKKSSPDQLQAEILRSSYDDLALQNVVNSANSVNKMQKII